MMQKRIQGALYGLLLTLGLFAGCASVPETDRSQLMLVSPAEEVRLGTDAFAEIREELDLIEHGTEVEMLREVGERIVIAGAPELEERGFDDLDWEFHLADSDTVNAFVLPAGKVVFYRGILPVLENEDGVAAVMGHEVAHVIGRHIGERISMDIMLQFGFFGMEIVLSDRDPAEREMILAALGFGAMVGVQLPYSRAHEAEADDIGLILMARAGYDPREAVAVWERMDALSSGRPPEFLSTHPHPENRVRELEKRMPEALEIYRAAAPP